MRKAAEATGLALDRARRSRRLDRRPLAPAVPGHGRGHPRRTERPRRVRRRPHPAVVVPQTRPHGEQHATARALAGAGLATVREHWPEPHEWPALLDTARRTGGERWRLWAPATAPLAPPGCSTAWPPAPTTRRSTRARRGDHPGRGPPPAPRPPTAGPRRVRPRPDHYVVVTSTTPTPPGCCGTGGPRPTSFPGPGRRTAPAGRRPQRRRPPRPGRRGGPPRLPGRGLRPRPALLSRYAETARDGALLCGTVAYLPPRRRAATASKPCRPSHRRIRDGPYRRTTRCSPAVTTGCSGPCPSP